VQLTELVDPEPASGRVFERTLMPGIADGIGDMRIRLDAIARWLQDVAYADLLDAGFRQEGMWIIRRVRLRVAAWPRFGEEATVRTFCSGVGRFSAERRSTLRGAGGHVDAVALWIWIDASGEPGRFPQEFVDIYGESAAGRGAPVRLRHPEPPAGAERIPWTFRAADVDVAGHVNNSHYWAPLEEQLAGAQPDGIDAEIEHREPALPGPALVLRDGSGTWIADAEGGLHASIQLAHA
jgi:acyl-ACP thioesterase